MADFLASWTYSHSRPLDWHVAHEGRWPSHFICRKSVIYARHKMHPSLMIKKQRPGMIYVAKDSSVPSFDGSWCRSGTCHLPTFSYETSIAPPF